MQFHQNVKVVCLLLLLPLQLGLCNLLQPSSDQESATEPCPYEQTVSTEDWTWHSFATKTYQNIEMTDQQMYDYKIKFGNERVPYFPHRRGCACKAKPCTKLCCQWHQYFNLETKQCENTYELGLNASSDIWLKNTEENSDKDRFVNVLDYFTLQFDIPCQDKTKAISLQNSLWELYNVSK